LNTAEAIILNIDPNEVVVRGISTEFHYSSRKGKLRENAFTPPPNSLQVSMNRLKYSDANTCKQHAKTISYPDSSVYIGLITIRVGAIININNANDRDYPYVLASPMKSKTEYYNLDLEPVYTNSEGNPAHCDLCYVVQPEAHAPQTIFRKIAKQFLDVVGVHLDSNPEHSLWTSGNIP
jgi:hypothetical protein